MNDAEYKSIEGQRIQQVLGAIGALPAAMLVFGDGPAISATGAPLFVAAIVLVIGSLMNWNYTDAAYHMDSLHMELPEEHQPAHLAWMADLERAGYQFQHRTYGYAIASLLCSILGVAGVYSTLRSGVSVNVGFLVTVGLGLLTSGDVVALGMKRNALMRRVRALSVFRTA